MLKSRNFPNRFKGVATSIQTNAWSQFNTEATGGLFKDRIVDGALLLWIVPISLAAMYAFLTLPLLSNQIPLFYSKVWGEGQLAQKNLIYLPILIAFVFGGINFMLSFWLRKKDTLFMYFLIAGADLISLLAAITVFNIISLIT